MHGFMTCVVEDVIPEVDAIQVILVEFVLK